MIKIRHLLCIEIDKEDKFDGFLIAKDQKALMEKVEALGLDYAPHGKPIPYNPPRNKIAGILLEKI